MNKTLFLVVFLALAVPALCDIWSSCGSSTDHFQIGQVVITPDPPVKGQSINITASGFLVITYPIKISDMTTDMSDYLYNHT
ncbi:hypothetical protein PPL_00543 [Heterostelium album PN500]|uniref:Uncharacterized protein n=1 Tax=Heterostelium pallidum (strain ATCC 26659 / Pp 5 / PN500) TaxID=670386 RepID=D3AWR5_HETP5|nr:hypothetical protein PPL_00543 [Heterostelium album PN500]EFA86738.1 hypothetical protein PPL_00543 [Heterostelium album PN500]|eukprot:XP_020438842.1 hypothetical protein PPL_00543 [Heterostelium album PN500]